MGVRDDTHRDNRALVLPLSGVEQWVLSTDGGDKECKVLYNSAQHDLNNNNIQCCNNVDIPFRPNKYIEVVPLSMQLNC